jgi:hypothetical protein
MKVVDDKNMFERYVDVAYQSNTVSGIDRKVTSQLFMEMEVSDVKCSVHACALHSQLQVCSALYSHGHGAEFRCYLTYSAVR